jgi:hypothetical protein
MVLLKSGLISFIQYMMLKPIKHRLKIVAICCSKSGHLFAFEVHTGNDNTADKSAYETMMRMLRDSGMASRGKGRTPVTDNWYSSGSLMASIWKEFGITFMGTINLASKKSRTADDFPFYKLSPGALRRVKRGWFWTATQNVKIGRQTAFTMQASVWRDKKHVAMLHNVDVIHPSQDMHTVLRMPPKSKKKKVVDSPRVISSYAPMYNEWTERTGTPLTGLSVSRATGGISGYTTGCLMQPFIQATCLLSTLETREQKPTQITHG